MGVKDKLQILINLGMFVLSLLTFLATFFNKKK